jgi:hypothetical protein
LNQEKRVIVEAKDATVGASRVLLSVAEKLIILSEGDGVGPVHFGSTQVNTLEEVVGLDKVVRIAELGVFCPTHFVD